MRKPPKLSALPEGQPDNKYLATVHMQLPQVTSEHLHRLTDGVNVHGNDQRLGAEEAHVLDADGQGRTLLQVSPYYSGVDGEARK